MSLRKPVYVLCEKNVTRSQTRAALEGIHDVLRLAGISDVEVKNFGNWKSSPAVSPSMSYASLKWFIANSYNTERKQVDADEFLHLIWKGLLLPEACTAVALLSSDLYCERQDFIIGYGAASENAVLSVHRFRILPQRQQHECIKTLVMHELGHVFGLLPESRTRNVEESIGKHCTNICIMRQGLNVPDDWTRMTDDRLRTDPFCNQCLHDLRKSFF